MRIITGILSVIGVAALAVLAVFGGLYLMDRYSPSDTTGDGSYTSSPHTTQDVGEAETTRQPPEASPIAQSPSPAAPSGVAPTVDLPPGSGFGSPIGGNRTVPAPSGLANLGPRVIEASCQGRKAGVFTVLYSPDDPQNFHCVHPASTPPKIPATENGDYEQKYYDCLRSEIERQPGVKPVGTIYCATARLDPNAVLLERLYETGLLPRG